MRPSVLLLWKLLLVMEITAGGNSNVFGTFKATAPGRLAEFTIRNKPMNATRY